MCGEGERLEAFMNLLDSFTGSYFATVSPLCQVILRSWAAVWMAWKLADLAFARGIDPKEAAEQLLIFIFADWLFWDRSLLWSVTDVIMSSGLFAASKAFTATGAGTPTSLADVVCYSIGGIDHHLWSGVRQSIMDVDLIGAFGKAVMALVIFIASSWLVLKILNYCTIPITRLTAVLLCLPFVVVLFAVPALRRTALTAIKTIMASALELVVVSGIVATFMVMIGKVSGLMPFQNGSINLAGQDWLGGATYWTILIMVVIFTFVLDEIMKVPAQLLEITAAHAVWRTR